MAGGIGFLLAVQPQQAAADGLLPTISIPSLPVTLPTVTLPPVPPTTTTTSTTSTAPTTTAAATTTTAGSTTSAGSTTTAGSTTPPPTGTPGSPPSTGQPGATTATTGTGGSAGGGASGTRAASAIAGAVRLADGSISIPVTSVKSPNRLLLVVTLAPRALQGAMQPIRANVRVRDTRGYFVRGAKVAIRSVPAGRLSSVAARRTATDGRTAFVVRVKPNLRQTSRLSLLVNAADPARARIVSTSRAVSIPIRPRRR